MEKNGWGIELVSGRLRIYRIDEHGLADEDIEADLSILPTLYAWLEARQALEGTIKGQG